MAGALAAARRPRGRQPWPALMGGRVSVDALCDNRVHIRGEGVRVCAGGWSLRPGFVNAHAHEPRTQHTRTHARSPPRHTHNTLRLHKSAPICRYTQQRRGVRPYLEGSLVAAHCGRLVRRRRWRATRTQGSEIGDTSQLQGHGHGHTIAGGSRGGQGNLSYGGNECHAIINHSYNSAGLHQ